MTGPCEKGPSTSVDRPRLLDLFCCEGGAAKGYADAGFEVFGVDLFKHTVANGQRVGFSQKRYPYFSAQGDALAVLDELIAGHAVDFWGHDAKGFKACWTLRLGAFDAIHASPPCQHASAGTRAMRAHGDDRHPALIEPTRERLIQTGLPYVIENVKGAALIDPITLCWSMFGEDAIGGPVHNEDGIRLRMERHRLFESNVPITAPADCHHPEDVQVAGSYGAAQRTIAGAKRRGGGYVPSKEIQGCLLGIDWMTEAGLHQCLPPVYTRHLGVQLRAHISGRVAA